MTGVPDPEGPDVRPVAPLHATARPAVVVDVGGALLVAAVLAHVRSVRAGRVETRDEGGAAVVSRRG